MGRALPQYPALYGSHYPQWSIIKLGRQECWGRGWIEGIHPTKCRLSPHLHLCMATSLRKTSAEWDSSCEVWWNRSRTLVHPCAQPSTPTRLRISKQASRGVTRLKLGAYISRSVLYLLCVAGGGERGVQCKTTYASLLRRQGLQPA